MSSNIVLTLRSDLADVSHNTKPCSSAYACASSVVTWWYKNGVVVWCCMVFLQQQHTAAYSSMQ